LETEVVELSGILGGEYSKEACSKVVEGFRQHGVIVIKDPRVDEEKNKKFIDLMARYFESRSQKFYKGLPLDDCYPEFGYQSGVTPEFVWKNRDYPEVYAGFTAENKPMSPVPSVRGAAWRYLWGIGTPDCMGRQIVPPRLAPADFPEWQATMDSWGEILKTAAEVVTRMMEEGLGLRAAEFSSRLSGAPHVLSPNGSNLTRYGREGQILSGFHYDLNFLTVHSKSNFPGLFIWLRSGKKVLVKVPPGCLLIQAGKMLEYLSGGYFYAGFHEVVVSKETVEAIAQARASNSPLWRVSSTFFAGLNYDKVLEPLPIFSSAESLRKYPPVPCYDFVHNELSVAELLPASKSETPNPRTDQLSRSSPGLNK
jgi:isopenicillin N synthase-like dioxygenase